MKTKWLITDLFILGTISLILNIFNIRICPFYNIFKIPCPGCGLTRAFIELFKLNLLESVRYNILCIPISLAFLVYFLFVLLKKEKCILNFFNVNKVLIIIISVLFLFISFLINLNNSLLY